MPDRRWLILDLEAPLLAFGDVTIDHVGATRDFPAISMLTGLLANALGYVRTEWEKHQVLQDRLVFAVRRERENPAGLLTDIQNARLMAGEEGWTTWGRPEKRAGGSLDKAPHRRRRDYHMDSRAIVALRLEPADADPDLDRLREALDRPARPLFIGRKPCLPSGRLYADTMNAATAYEALQRIPGPDPNKGLRAQWPLAEGPETGEDVHRIHDLADLRNWRTGLHGGVRKVVEGVVTPQEGAA